MQFRKSRKEIKDAGDGMWRLPSRTLLAHARDYTQHTRPWSFNERVVTIVNLTGIVFICKSFPVMRKLISPHEVRLRRMFRLRAFLLQTVNSYDHSTRRLLPDTVHSLFVAKYAAIDCFVMYELSICYWIVLFYQCCHVIESIFLHAYWLVYRQVYYLNNYMWHTTILK